MIPNESTPVKNDILIDIFAKGRLTYAEMRIASFIMRWSWGFDKGEKRQEWTKQFTISEIAKEIEMNYSLCIRTINEMVRQGKLIKDANRYRFNENYQEWNITSSGTITRNNILTKSNENITKSNYTLTKSNTNITKSNGINLQQNTIETSLNAQNPLRKENIKENKDKETIKKIDYALKDKNQNFLLKDEKHEKAKELIKEFSKLRNIPLDSGFFSKNIRSARALVSTYPVEYILAGIEWRLANDHDGFWEEKLWSLNSVYSHFAEWIAQAKLSTGKTFEDWLDRNPSFDYRKIEEEYARVKAFFVAFNKALKAGVSPTKEEWAKYQLARKLSKEQIRK